MSDCYLVSVLGSGQTHPRHNVKEARNSRKPNAAIYPRDRIGQAMRLSKGKILSDEQRADISKAWKQTIVGDKFIYNAHARR